MARGLRRIRPFRRLLEVGHRDAGDLARLLEAHPVRLERCIESHGVLGDEVLVVPALLDHVRQQAVEQRDVGARPDVEVQHVLLARNLLRHGDGHGAARVHDDHLRALGRLAGEPLLLLAGAVPGQVLDPVGQEVIGLRLVRIGADEDGNIIFDKILSSPRRQGEAGTPDRQGMQGWCQGGLAESAPEREPVVTGMIWGPPSPGHRHRCRATPPCP